ncbi:MAG TPA: cell division protein FtsA [Candidatus Woesebacteria bacterium]|nr:cell division protein FtsA [Candidatus Woesebacteria bacterium]
MQHSRIINGIDIGSTKITTIIGQYFDVEDRFNIVAVSSSPAAGFRKGQIVNIDQATQAITQSVEAAERMAGFQINNAVVSIAANYIESQNSHSIVSISSPNNEIIQHDISRIIEASKSVSIPVGKEIIHVIPRKYIVDDQDGVINPIGMSGSKLELESHLIFASSPAIKNIRKCFDDVGIKIDSLVYSGLASAKACLTNTEKELGIALIDIGGTVTSLTIFTEGKPAFSSVIPVGSANVTNDLAIGLRLSLEDADKVKLKLEKFNNSQKFEDEIDISQFGIISEEKHKISLQTAINGIIKPRLEEIFTIIYNQIESSGLINLIPSGIVLTGGGSQILNIKDTCSKVIPLPVRIANPPKIGGVIDDIQNPAFVSSIGLLQYGLTEVQFTPSANKKIANSFTGIFGKLKSIIEPLLP